MGEERHLDYADPQVGKRPPDAVASFGIGCGGSIVSGVITLLSAIVMTAAIGGAGVVFDEWFFIFPATVLVCSVAAFAYCVSLTLKANERGRRETYEEP